MQRLTLELTRLKGYDEQETQSFSVDMPKSATEDDLRLAFEHVVAGISARAYMDAAAELVARLVADREELEVVETAEQDVRGPAAGEAPPTMEEERTAQAEKLGAYTPPPEEQATSPAPRTHPGTA